MPQIWTSGGSDLGSRSGHFTGGTHEIMVSSTPNPTQMGSIWVLSGGHPGYPGVAIPRVPPQGGSPGPPRGGPGPPPRGPRPPASQAILRISPAEGGATIRRGQIPGPQDLDITGGTHEIRVRSPGIHPPGRVLTPSRGPQSLISWVCQILHLRGPGPCVQGPPGPPGGDMPSRPSQGLALWRGQPSWPTRHGW